MSQRGEEMQQPITDSNPVFLTLEHQDSLSDREQSATGKKIHSQSGSSALIAQRVIQFLIPVVVVKSLCCVQFFCNPMDCSPLSMGFSRQKYWSGLPFPSPGIFLTQG